MLSLYWKVFLGFWITSLTLSSTAVYISLELRQDTSIELSGLSPSNVVERTTFIARRLSEDIDEWGDQLQQHDIQLYVVKNQRSLLSKPSFKQDISVLFEKLEQSLYVEESTMTRLRVGRKEISLNGEYIKFVLDMPSSNIFRAKELARNIGVQVLLALIVSGIACYILARYLTRNLKLLSIASQSLAKGDLTARAALSNMSRNDELSQLGSDFNDMASTLEQSIEAQKRLVRDISHELRSPLSRLQIALELARHSNTDEQLNRIEQEANRLNELISQILTIPDDTAPLEDTIDLVALLEHIVDDSEIEANVKSVKVYLICEIEEALVQASSLQLHSAIENILRNAIKYTKENSDVQIELKSQLFDNKKQFFQITVDDHGPGVPEQDIEQIFEPFYRVDRARNRMTGGYGIGLAIVKRVIERHGGHASANNTGTGLRIQISVPQAAEL